MKVISYDHDIYGTIRRNIKMYRKEKNIVWLNGNDNIVEKAKELVEEFLKN